MSFSNKSGPSHLIQGLTVIMFKSLTSTPIHVWHHLRQQRTRSYPTMHPDRFQREHARPFGSNKRFLWAAEADQSPVHPLLTVCLQWRRPESVPVGVSPRLRWIHQTLGRAAAAEMGNWVIGDWKLIESTTITNYIW